MMCFVAFQAVGDGDLGCRGWVQFPPHWAEAVQQLNRTWHVIDGFLVHLYGGVEVIPLNPGQLVPLETKQFASLNDSRQFKT
jgi:hypothetical protein